MSEEPTAYTRWLKSLDSLSRRILYLGLVVAAIVIPGVFLGLHMRHDLVGVGVGILLACVPVTVIAVGVGIYEVVRNPNGWTDRDDQDAR